MTTADTLSIAARAGIVITQGLLWAGGIVLVLLILAVGAAAVGAWIETEDDADDWVNWNP